MNGRAQREVALLLLGAVFGLVLGIPCNIWASVYTEITVNGRSDLWTQLGFWTLGILVLSVPLFLYAEKLASRGDRSKDIENELASLRNQLTEMKAQIEKKIEKLHGMQEKSRHLVNDS